jgi:hypothetical protein
MPSLIVRIIELRPFRTAAPLGGSQLSRRPPSCMHSRVAPGEGGRLTLVQRVASDHRRRTGGAVSGLALLRRAHRPPLESAQHRDHAIFKQLFADRSDVARLLSGGLTR